MTTTPSSTEVRTIRARKPPQVELMRFHQPGWSLEVDEGTDNEITYMVWGPGEVRMEGIPSGKRRDHWAACWSDPEGIHGDFVEGSSVSEVLDLFPRHVAKMFHRAIEDPLNDHPDQTGERVVATLRAAATRLDPAADSPPTGASESAARAGEAVEDV